MSKISTEKDVKKIIDVIVEILQKTETGCMEAEKLLEKLKLYGIVINEKELKHVVYLAQLEDKLEWLRHGPYLSPDGWEVIPDTVCLQGADPFKPERQQILTELRQEAVKAVSEIVEEKVSKLEERIRREIKRIERQIEAIKMELARLKGEVVKEEDVLTNPDEIAVKVYEIVKRDYPEPVALSVIRENCKVDEVSLYDAIVSILRKWIGKPLRLAIEQLEECLGYERGELLEKLK